MSLVTNLTLREAQDADFVFGQLVDAHKAIQAGTRCVLFATPTKDDTPAIVGEFTNTEQLKAHATATYGLPPEEWQRLYDTHLLVAMQDDLLLCAYVFYELLS